MLALPCQCQKQCLTSTVYKDSHFILTIQAMHTVILEQSNSGKEAMPSAEQESNAASSVEPLPVDQRSGLTT